MKSSEIIFEVDLTGFHRSAPIFTEAETIPELEEAVRDAVHCHFDEGEAPSVIRLHLVRDLVISA